MKKHFLSGLSFEEILIVIILISALLLTLQPIIGFTGRSAANTASRQNLRAISLALHRHALEHEGAFPGDLAVLKLGNITNSYVYNPGLGEEGEPRAIVLYDKGIEPDGKLQKDLYNRRHGVNAVQVCGRLVWIAVDKDRLIPQKVDEWPEQGVWYTYFAEKRAAEPVKAQVTPAETPAPAAPAVPAAEKKEGTAGQPAQPSTK